MSEPLVFQEFDSVAEADKVLAILKEGGIKASVEKAKGGLLDDNFTGTKYEPAFQLKMEGADFTKARKILLEKYEVNLEELDEHYMLLAFSNQELMDIIAKPDEWGFYNYNIANALLKQRGIEVNVHQKEALQNERLQELAQQKPISSFWIFFGYAVPALNLLHFISGYQKELAESGGWAFPGVGGIMLGYIMSKAKKTLPDGQRIAVYNKSTQLQGFLILRINLLFWLVNIVLFIINILSFI